MNGLKQRIIGALVLVSLAVIFVPMMFDEPHSERETSTIQIPEEPPFPEVEMPEPETTEPPEYQQKKPASAEFTRSLDGAWVVQLGSFGSAENARRLREQVRERGYSSHLQSVTRGDVELTRVFSGPFAEKAEAERAKQALDKAFGLNSLVTSGGQ